MDWKAPFGESELSTDVNCILTCIPVKVRMCGGAASLGESVGIRGRFRGKPDQASWEPGWGDLEVRENPPLTYICFLTSLGDSVNLG